MKVANMTMLPYKCWGKKDWRGLLLPLGSDGASFHGVCSAVLCAGCCCWLRAAITFSWNDSTRCSSDISSCRWVFVYTAKLYRGMDAVTGPPHSLEQPRSVLTNGTLLFFAVCLSLNCLCVCVCAHGRACVRLWHGSAGMFNLWTPDGVSLFVRSLIVQWCVF